MIPLFASVGFIAYLRNLLCSMDRTNTTNYFIVAFDNETCPALHAHRAHSNEHTCVQPYAQSTRGGSVIAANAAGSTTFTYRSGAFNRLVMQRPLWVRWLLQQGWSVIQCDLDIVWLRDPQLVLQSLVITSQRKGSSVAHARQGTADSSEVVPDVLFQSEQAYGLNGGFYFARPNNRTLNLFDDWLGRLEKNANSPKFEEQHALNWAVRVQTPQHRQTPQTLRHGVLSDAHFPNGKIWFLYPFWADKHGAFLVHANWVIRSKKQRLMRDRLWFLDSNDEACVAGLDPFVDNCSHLCVPIASSAPGSGTRMHSCSYLNSADDGQARRWGKQREVELGKPPSRQRHEVPHGFFWHPSAYAAIGCARNTSAPYAAAMHALLGWA